MVSDAVEMYECDHCIRRHAIDQTDTRDDQMMGKVRPSQARSQATEKGKGAKGARPKKEAKLLGGVHASWLALIISS